MDHAQGGDTLCIRIFVTPILVYFVSLLVIAMVMVPPMAPLARAVSLVGHRLRGHCLCAKTHEQELVWDVLLPLASFALTVIAAIAWALEASFANSFNAIGVVILLITALRKSWIVTLVIATRINPTPKKRRVDPAGRHASLSLVGREALVVPRPAELSPPLKPWRGLRRVPFPPACRRASRTHSRTPRR